METRWATADMAGQFRHVAITDGADDPLQAVTKAIARMKAGGPVHTEIILNVIPPGSLPEMLAGFEQATRSMESKSAIKEHAIQLVPPALRDLLSDTTRMPDYLREPLLVRDKYRGRLHVDQSRRTARFKISAGIYFAGEGMVIDTRPVDEILAVSPDSTAVPRWTFKPDVDVVVRHGAQIVTPPGSVVICREQPMGAHSDWTVNDPPAPHASGGGVRLGVVFY